MLMGIELHELLFMKPPTIQELICTGGIHTGLLLGESKISPEILNFTNETFSVFKNDTLVTSGLSKAMWRAITPLRAD